MCGKGRIQGDERTVSDQMYPRVCLHSCEKVTAHVIKTYWRLNRLHSSRLRQQHEMAAAAAAAAEQRAAFALREAMAGAGRPS